ncbi:MAG: hypothetical protein SVU32_00810, partial [Candidatus Nanohaloarchaea archaeon]|nr:hypothetical protein [Candidatus Nanohaloarchaea archaeon]
VVLHDEPLDGDLLEALDDEVIFYTRERKWHLFNSLLDRMTDRGHGPGIDITAAYEPRGSDLELDLMEESDMAASSTAIRQSIVADDDRWREWVPDSTEQIIDGQYEKGKDAMQACNEQTRRDAAWKHAGQLVSLDWSSFPSRLYELL